LVKVDRLTIFSAIDTNLERIEIWSNLIPKRKVVLMTFDEALNAANNGDLTKAIEFFDSDTNLLSNLVLKKEEQHEFHDDDTTSLRREFTLLYKGVNLASWWEEYAGYYGGGYTGWWVEETNCNGPSTGMKLLLEEIGLAIPEVEVPQPPVSEDEEED